MTQVLAELMHLIPSWAMKCFQKSAKLLVVESSFIFLICLKYNIDFVRTGYSCIIDLYYHQQNSSYSTYNAIVNTA